MIPILDNKKEDTILINKITRAHIVVGFRQDGPVFATLGVYEKQNTAKLYCISQRLSDGNAFFPFTSIYDLVKNMVNKGEKVAVFHENDWKDALKWLIDNA